MSTNEQTLLSQPTSVMRNTVGKEQAPQDLVRPISDEALGEYYDKNYHQFYPIKRERYTKEGCNKKAQGKEEPQERPQTRYGMRVVFVQKFGTACSVLPSPEEGILERKPCSRRLEKGGISIGLGNKEKNVPLPLKRIPKANKGRKGSSGMHENLRIYARNYQSRDDQTTTRQNPQVIDEMLRVTTTFLIGEVAASNRERKKSFPSWKQQEAGQKQNFKRGSFRNQQRTERKQDRFTLITKTPKEILALDKGKFKPPPPMTTPVEKRNASKFCEFHGEVGHITDECMHLKRQIEEMLKARKLSHLIKELKQNNGKDQTKTAKKGEISGKDKSLTILMVQP
ncbi:hypothetical protein Tco_0140514 [Tanacetum coccineum]